MISKNNHNFFTLSNYLGKIKYASDGILSYEGLSTVPPPLPLPLECSVGGPWSRHRPMEGRVAQTTSYQGKMGLTKDSDVHV